MHYALHHAIHWFQKQIRGYSAFPPDTTAYWEPIRHHPIHINIAASMKRFHDLHDFAVQAEAAQ